MVSIILNLCLGIFKYICGTISGLSSITSDAANNLSDAATAVMTVIGVKMASTLGGQRHQNGHGRLEWIVGIVVSCSIMLVGWESLGNSIQAIKHPSEPEFNIFILLVMLVSIGVKIFLFCFNMKKCKENNSSAYKAAAADCVSDAVSTSVVTITFLMDSIWHLHLDGWCGILVSLFIMRNGLQSFAEVSRRVLGEVANDDLSAQLEQFVLTYNKELIGEVVDLQLLDYGYERYGASLTVRAQYGADQAKFLLMIADLKSDIYQKFGYITTIEPEIPATLSIQEQVKAVVRQKISELDKNLIVADNTRVNEGTNRPQAVIYILVPLAYSKREHKIYQEVRNKLEGHDFSYTVKLLAGNIRNR
jgi:cation diffusion facilitator family transporter